MGQTEPPSNAQIAADVAVAIEYNDREALVEALRVAKGSQHLQEDILQELADMLMEAE